MKRLILLLIAIVLLSACGKNENISESMHKDVEQIFTIIETSIKEDRDSTSAEWDTIIEYEVKYDNMYDDKELSDDERLLKVKVDLIIALHDPGYTLKSMEDNVITKIDETKHYMKTGEF